MSGSDKTAGLVGALCRVGLSAALLVCVYRETGWAVTTFAALMLLQSEVVAWALRRHGKEIRSTARHAVAMGRVVLPKNSG